jgi:lipopolysaccharide export LptBFGC system permease protein LptF
LFTTKLKIVVPVFGLVIALIEPALAGSYAAAVPAPIIGAGLPALAIFGGGYWLIRKLRDRH